MVRAVLFAFLVASFAVAPAARAIDDAVELRAPGWRNQSGSLNYAPRPGLYTVIAVDEYRETLRLRSRNGAEADVHVDDRIHDLSTLRPGDLVQVDFFIPATPGEPLAAATIWRR